MFTHAYLEELGRGKLRREEALLREECEKRGIPVTLFTAKQMNRRRLPLSRQVFVSGDMTAVRGALRQLGIEVPPPNDYPECLRPYFRRPIWSSTLGEVERSIYDGTGASVFMKPAERCKSFTGSVFSTPDDFHWIGSTSRREKVWCSAPVEWLSEYRVYVVGNDILSVDHYAGDPAVLPDQSILEGAVRVYRSSGSAPAGYGIDFGVLQSGATALLEANDGFSLGAYKIGAHEYTELLFTRWRELMGARSLSK